jgi:hypothetical protein
MACIKAIEGRTRLMKLQEGEIATDIEAELEKKLSCCLKEKEMQSLSGTIGN